MSKMVNIYSTLDRGRTIQKWLPVIETTYEKHKYNISKSLMEELCMYMEWCSTKANIDNITHEDLPLKLKSVYDKLKGLDMRVEVVGRFFNKATGRVELKLSNGEYILENYDNYKVSDDVLLEIFDHDFLFEWKPDLIRDYKLDKILDNGSNN
jgi:hypothetical protein